jgi:hypothetical protein
MQWHDEIAIHPIPTLVAIYDILHHGDISTLAVEMLDNKTL